MRYVAYRTGFESGDGGVVVGVLDPSGAAIAPIAPIADFYADPSSFLRAAPTGAAVPREQVRTVPPVPAGARVLCLGLNYRAHAAESGAEPPSRPTVFGRFTSTLCCDGDPVAVPPAEGRLDWEAELVAVLGAGLRSASPAEAQRAVLGFTCGNDLSARGFQMATSQWTLGKNTPGSAPIGPEVVTADELGDHTKLHIGCTVNGAVMQSASTADMIFGVAESLAYISGAMDLHPGDLLFTGTPEGVGFTREPPVFLVPGDTVTVEIEGIGTLTNTIVGA